MENTVSRYQFQGPILWNCLNSRFQIGKPLRNCLIYLRTMKSLSMADLAQAAGVGKATVSLPLRNNPLPICF